MRKKLAVILTLALATTTVLSGCGSSSSSSSEESSDGVTKIRFATWDSAEDLDAQQALVDEYNASQDKVEVVLEAYGDDFDTKISAGMGSSDAPDVMYMWNYPEYYGGLYPLDELIAAEGDDFKADYYDALWDYNSMDGTIYGMPVGFSTQCLYYNKDIFAQAGIDEPTADWTWEDLDAAAKTITEKCDGVTGFSFMMTPDPYDYEMFLWGNGTAYCDENGNMDGYINSQNAIDVLTLFQNMEKEGYAVATESSGTDEFSAQTTAMYIYGTWSIGTLNDAGVNYGIVELPSFSSTGKSVSILSSSGLSISADTKNVEAAWDFVKYWTGSDCNLARIDYELPTLKSVVEAQGVMEDAQKAPFYNMLEKSSGYTTASFIIDSWSEVAETLELSFERMFNPSSLEDPKTVLNEAVQ